MSNARCWFGFRPSTATAPGGHAEADSKAIAHSRAKPEPEIRRISSTLCQKLLRVFRRDDFDLDQESRICQGRNPNNGAHRKIGLRAAKELRVAFHERLEVHRRARIVNQKHLHL